MDFCYDGNLSMPSSFVVMDEEEMAYTEGGFYVNANICSTITTHINNICKVCATVLALSALEKTLKKAAVAIGKWIVSLFSSIGGAIGAIVGLVGAAFIIANATSFCVGTVTADKKNTGVEMKWYVAHFGGYNYY